MKLEELKVFSLSMDLAEKIWKIITEWEYFEKKTVGSQLVRAADSIAANISEGYGRFSFKENKQFCYYARGSLFETTVWLRKAYIRKLIKEEDFNSIIKDLKDLSVKLNNYIKSLGPNTKTTL
jgi:four helix bundle protein